MLAAAPAAERGMAEGAICPNCERITSIHHCQACGADFVPFAKSATPAPESREAPPVKSYCGKVIPLRYGSSFCGNERGLTPDVCDDCEKPEAGQREGVGAPAAMLGFEDLKAAHAFIDWNRGQKSPPVVIGSEIAVFEVAQRLASAQQANEWRCFHCDERFTDKDAAALHFGTHEYQEPACLIDIAKYREMEALQLRYADEDACVHRTMRRMETEHQQALRSAEEAGYARGLADAAKYPEEVATLAQRTGSRGEAGDA